MTADPDVVLIAGSGTPAALPERTLKERGYKGKIYQIHGVANNDFLRLCGKECEGAWLPAGPMLVADQLPDSNPVKRSAERTSEPMKRPTAWDQCRPLVATHGTPARCCSGRFPRR